MTEEQMPSEQEQGNDTRLWCLHHIGPDDVHPAPDFATAQKWADWANTAFAEHAEISRFVVAIWPWDADSHADGLAASIAGWTLPTPDAVNADKAVADGEGWVFWGPDSGEEYAPQHPVESGEVPDAEQIRRSTAQEDVLWQAFQAEAERAHKLSTTPAPDKALMPDAAVGACTSCGGNGRYNDNYTDCQPCLKCGGTGLGIEQTWPECLDSNATHNRRRATSAPVEEPEKAATGEVGLHEAATDLLRAMHDGQQHVGYRIDLWNRLEAALAATNAGQVEERREGCVGTMSPDRAVYFLQRFKRDEKMLGPHEQWALDYTIAALQPKQVEQSAVEGEAS
jgi:hypothetical protein